MLACIIEVDSDESVRIEHVEPDLETLQTVVGGYLEVVLINSLSTVHGYVNEDGIRLNLPLNVLASRLAGTQILGNMIILGNGANGEEADCPDTIYALLINFLQMGSGFVNE